MFDKFIQVIRDTAAGKKTYLTAVGLVAFGIYQIIILKDVPGGIQSILGAFGLSFLAMKVDNKALQTQAHAIQAVNTAVYAAVRESRGPDPLNPGVRPAPDQSTFQFYSEPRPAPPTF